MLPQRGRTPHSGVAHSALRRKAPGTAHSGQAAGTGLPAAQGRGHGPAGPRCRLGAAGSPQRHCAGSTVGIHRRAGSRGVRDWAARGHGGDMRPPPVGPHLAGAAPAQAASQLLVLQLLGLAIRLVLCKTPVHPVSLCRDWSWPHPQAPASPPPRYGPMCPQPLAPREETAEAPQVQT